MWRINPQNRSQVVDRFGRIVASVSPGVDANLIAAAPDMYEVLQSLENDDGSTPQPLWEEIQLVLRRVRGEFGVAFFSNVQRRLGNQEWLRFIEQLWKGPSHTQD